MAYTYDAEELLREQQVRTRVVDVSNQQLSLLGGSTSANLKNVRVKVRKNNFPASVADASSQAEVIYPHLYDEKSDDRASIAIKYVKNAIAELDLAIDAYRGADMNGLWAKICQVADDLRRAQEYTQFNESFGAVVSHAQRAVASCNIDTVSKDAIFALQRVLKDAISAPMLNLSRAVDLIDRLDAAGWTSVDIAVENFAEELLAYFGFSSSPSEIPESQKAQRQLEI